MNLRHKRRNKERAKLEEEKEYKCIKKLSLPKCDEYEVTIDEEFFVVPVDSVWILQEESSMSDIRLESNLGWIEIDFEDFKNYFAEI